MFTDANNQNPNLWKFAVLCFSGNFPRARYIYDNALDYLKQYILSNILSFLFSFWQN